MSILLKTGGLFTTALLSTAALDVLIPSPAAAEPTDPNDTFPAPQPITVSPTPQPLVPVPMALPVLEHSGQIEPSASPAGESAFPIAPSLALPLPLTATAIELKVEPAPVKPASAPPRRHTLSAVPVLEPAVSQMGEPVEAATAADPEGSATNFEAIAPEPAATELAIDLSSAAAERPLLEAATAAIAVNMAPPTLDSIPLVVETTTRRGDAPDGLDNPAPDSTSNSASSDSGLSDTPENGAAEQNWAIAIEALGSPTPTATLMAANTTAAARVSETSDKPTADLSEKSSLLAAANSETAQNHRGWFDHQLSQNAARRKGPREAQLRENLLRTVQRYIVQNNVAAAQQIAQNPVFLEPERKALQQAIAHRQRPVGTAGAEANVEPKTPLAQDIARLAARQAWLLERLPSASTCQQADSIEFCGAPSAQTNYSWLIEAANRTGNAPAGSLPLLAAAPISSHYGWRIHPIYGDRRFHAGVDFAAPTGTPVYASASGYIDTSAYLSGYGYTVILESGTAQERYLYAHLSDMAVRPGQWVNQGDVVGWVGSTGNSTGPHLHFEVHRRGQQGWTTVDPLSVAAH